MSNWHEWVVKPQAILGALLGASAERWLVYVVFDSDDAIFFYKALRKSLGGKLVHVNDEEDVYRRDSERFVYIGVGDEESVCRNGVFRAGVWDPFCDRRRVGEFPHRPVIWWASNSAQWAGEAQHREWIGLRGALKTDRRGRRQSQWWWRASKAMWSSLINSAEGKCSFGEVEEVFDGLTRDITMRQAFDPDRYTLLSRIRMQRISDGLTSGVQAE